MGQATRSGKTTLLAAIGLAGILAGMLLLVNLLLSRPVQGQTVEPTLTALTGQPPQSILANGRAVYAVPINTGPFAAAILQYVTPPNGVAYVVHTFDGWGKSASTAVGWFRCADMISPSQYNGSQVEVEKWALLTDQERAEAKAACSL